MTKIFDLMDFVIYGIKKLTGLLGLSVNWMGTPASFQLRLYFLGSFPVAFQFLAFFLDQMSRSLVGKVT
jgi:hypothetical protein